LIDEVSPAALRLFGESTARAWLITCCAHWLSGRRDWLFARMTMTITRRRYGCAPATGRQPPKRFSRLSQQRLFRPWTSASVPAVKERSNFNSSSTGALTIVGAREVAGRFVTDEVGYAVEERIENVFEMLWLVTQKVRLLFE
jgi:hypothetical protein